MNDAKTTNETLLKVVGLTVRRRNQAILDQVDLEIQPREILTIIGPNGAGKTTLLQAILGLVALDAGRIERHPALVIGYVPQRLHIDAVLPLTVRNFIELSRQRTPQPAPLDELTQRLGCAQLLDRPFQSLSGGETQRVMLLRALLRRPNLLVLDEPTQGVDVAGEQEIYHLLEGLRHNQGISLLLVSHQLQLVMATTDRVICLNRHVCCSGRPVDVHLDPGFLALFGAAGTGVYQHRHDHTHAINGALQRDP